MSRAEFEAGLGRELIGQAEFAAAVRDAVAAGRPYAAGKLGVSERAWMLYPILIAGGASRLQLRVFEQTVRHKAGRHAGVFPTNRAFLLEFADRYGEALRELDCLGVDVAALRPTLDVLRFHDVGAAVMDYIEQEPDRSSPARAERCFTPGLGGKRVLLVSPYAEALQRQANQATFDAVWRKTGKRWFDPAAIDALEFPYGFARETQQRYASCLDLLAEIERRIDAHDYDVALIGAGALGVPLATFVRSRGKVGLSLGGSLQVLFGVVGKRWRDRPDWHERYFTDAWIDVPAHYRPDFSETDEDYW
jgi:hypothetical protein